MKNFLEGRIHLAKTLRERAPEVCYADLVLIFTAVVSACASWRWPGKGMDRKRFIELLVQHSPPESQTSWISVPALINQGLMKEDLQFDGIPDTRIYVGEEIDVSFDIARGRYDYLTDKDLRDHSYASLIYSWLRCGYSHEYCGHEGISEVPAAKGARVDYRNSWDGHKTTRLICFHIEYLLDLAEHHVSILPEGQQAVPDQWWIEHG